MSSLSNVSFRIAKILLYIAPLSILIVATGMFFPFIIGKAIFFRVAVELSLFFFSVSLLWKPDPARLADFKRIIRHPIFMAVAAFTVIFLIACVFGVNTQMSFWSNFERGEGGLQIIHYAVFFALLAFLLRTKKDWSRFMVWIIFIGILVSLYAVGQHENYLNQQAGVKPQDNPWINFVGANQRANGTLGNPLYLSTLALFLIFWLVLAVRESRHLWAKLTFGAILIFEIYIQILTDSRNGFAGLAGGIIALLIYFTVKNKSARLMWLTVQRASWGVLGLFVCASLYLFVFKREIFFGFVDLFRYGEAVKTINLAVGLALLAVLVYGSLGIARFLKEKISVRQVALLFLAIIMLFGAFFLGNRTSSIWKKIPVLNRFAHEKLLGGLSDRLWVWGSATAAFIEKPVIGWGPENFPYAFDKYYNPKHYGSDSWFDRAHDIYFEYLVGGGVLLFLAYLAIWIAYFYTLRKMGRKDDNSPYKVFSSPNLMEGVMIALPVTYFIQGLTAFEVLPIYIALFIFLAFTIRLADFGTSAAKHYEQKPKQPPKPESGISPVLGIILIAIIAVVVTGATYLAGYLPYVKNTMILSAASAQSDPQRIIETYDKIIDYYSPIGQQEAVQHYMWFVYRLFSASSKDAARIRESQQTVTTVKAVTARVNSLYDKNEKSLYRQVGVRTLNYSALVNYAGAMLIQDMGILDTAQTKLEEGLKIAPTRFEFIYPLLDIAIAKKDAALGEPLLKRAQLLRPDLASQNGYYEAQLKMMELGTSSLPISPKMK